MIKSGAMALWPDPAFRTSQSSPIKLLSKSAGEIALVIDKHDNSYKILVEGSVGWLESWDIVDCE